MEYRFKVQKNLIRIEANKMTLEQINFVVRLSHM